MRDPYEVLGVPRGATQEEISKAYKKLAKKYHPDLHPNDKTAEAKMSEINRAYDTLRSGKADGNAYGNYNTGSHGNYYGQGSYNYSSGSEIFSAVRRCIQLGQFFDALKLLDAINDRNGEWYYLAAVTHFNLGNKTTALNYASQAVKLDPDNMEYRQLLDEISSYSDAYSQRRTTYTNMNTASCLRCAPWLLCLCSGGRCFPWFCWC